MTHGGGVDFPLLLWSQHFSGSHLFLLQKFWSTEPMHYSTSMKEPCWLSLFHWLKKRMVWIEWCNMVSVIVVVCNHSFMSEWNVRVVNGMNLMPVLVWTTSSQTGSEYCRVKLQLCNSTTLLPAFLKVPPSTLPWAWSGVWSRTSGVCSRPLKDWFCFHHWLNLNCLKID